MMGRVRRALLSVWHKVGLVELASGLVELDIELISTGGTAKALRAAGLPVTDVSAVTGFPEMMDGRVKTLHPRIHGALLARRDVPEHLAECVEQGIELIDLVVVNLYPFAQTVARPNVALAEAIEQIDIGGPAMLRSAAKNHADVTVVCNPQRYDEVLEQLRNGQGETTLALRRELAREVFEHTAAYDQQIAAYLSGVAGD